MQRAVALPVAVNRGIRAIRVRESGVREESVVSSAVRRLPASDLRLLAVQASGLRRTDPMTQSNRLYHLSCELKGECIPPLLVVRS